MAGKQKGVHGREVFSRMNFLYQASALVVDKNPVLASHYGTLCKSIGKKTVLRMEPKMKRTLCKVCGIVLKPGTSADVEVNGDDTNKSQALHVICKFCSSSKNFVVNSNYSMWLDEPKSVAETISAKKEKK